MAKKAAKKSASTEAGEPRKGAGAAVMEPPAERKLRPTTWLPITMIEPSPDNPRRIHEGDADFRELVESIRAIGLQQAIVVRPIEREAAGGPKYRIVCGERRWRACRAAGLGYIEASVRDLTDQEAFVVTVTENLQRTNVSPLEEAAAIRKMGERGWTRGEIAAQLGKSERWVARRRALTDLCEECVAAATTPGHCLHDWPVVCWEMIAPLPEHEQQTWLAHVAEWHAGDPDSEEDGTDHRVPTRGDVREWLRDRLHDLSQAHWRLDDAELVPEAGACNVCANRSGCQRDLFDGADAEGDRCLDSACWAGKLVAWAAARRREIEEEHGQEPVLLSSYVHQLSVPEELSRAAEPSYRWMEAREGAEGARPALHLNGPRAGEVTWVRQHGSGGRSVGSSDGGESKPVPLAERRAQLARRRYRAALISLREEIEAKLDAGVPGLQELIGRYTSADATLAHVVRIALYFGTEGDFSQDAHVHPDAAAYRRGIVFRYDEDRERALFDASPSVLAGTLMRAVVPVAIRRLRNLEQDDRILDDEADQIARLLLLDFGEHENAAIEAMPEPKAWKALKADGTPKAVKAGKKKPAAADDEEE